MDWAIYIISNELWPIVDTVIMDDSGLMKRHLTNPYRGNQRSNALWSL